MVPAQNCLTYDFPLYYDVKTIWAQWKSFLKFWFLPELAIRGTILPSTAG